MTGTGGAGASAYREESDIKRLAMSDARPVGYEYSTAGPQAAGLSDRLGRRHIIKALLGTLRVFLLQSKSKSGDT